MKRQVHSLLSILLLMVGCALQDEEVIPPDPLGILGLGFIPDESDFSGSLNSDSSIKDIVASLQILSYPASHILKRFNNDSHLGHRMDSDSFFIQGENDQATVAIEKIPSPNAHIRIKAIYWVRPDANWPPKSSDQIRIEYTLERGGAGGWLNLGRNVKKRLLPGDKVYPADYFLPRS